MKSIFINSLGRYGVHIFLLTLLLVPHAKGTGGNYGPNYYLDKGGKRVFGSPEFYWELELKRLANEFHPPEKLHLIPREGGRAYLAPGGQQSWITATEAADQADYNAAIKSGEIKPSDETLAKQSHYRVREIICRRWNPVNLAQEAANANDLAGKASEQQEAPNNGVPEELPSEFADYDHGAYAFELGSTYLEAASRSWKLLLKRPASKRYFRSVWAAFMLGKLYMRENNPEAIKWFEYTRELAKEGFADSLGLAADSYGWEARSEWKLGHPEKAARLYLNQLALGDESALVSLKLLIPDRAVNYRELHSGPDPAWMKNWSEEQKRAYGYSPRLTREKAIETLETAARDPLMRRLETTHILATSTFLQDYGHATEDRAQLWLEIVQRQNMKKVEDAEYLGWLAYNLGDYKQAARWLDISERDSPAATWLRAKLQMRDGNLTGATSSMEQVCKTIIDHNAYTCWPHGSDKNTPIKADGFDFGNEWSEFGFTGYAAGDLGGLYLARTHFQQALDVLSKGGLGCDASFIAARILTTKELRQYVGSQYSHSSPLGYVDGQRAILGQRLVREGNYKLALTYLPAPQAQLLQRYLTEIQIGEDPKQSQSDRAQAFFTAAWLACQDGIQLMGLGSFPKGLLKNTNYYWPGSRDEQQSLSLAVERLSGTYTDFRELPANALSWSNSYGDVLCTSPFPLKPSPEEMKRLKATENNPYYRYFAVDLAMRAARLLPDNTDELADVLNAAGLWIKEQDDKLGNRIYYTIEKRCAQTDLGKEVINQHWFVYKQGPWSEKQDAAYTALREKLYGQK